MTTELGPSNATLTVHTGRAGMAAKAGHDLVLVASRWSGSLTLEPEDGSQSRMALNVDAGGLEVREGTGGVKPLTDDDRAEIKANIAKKVLHTDRHPEITFVSTTIEPTGDGSYDVVGDLTLAGTTRPVRFQLDVEPSADGTILRASVAIAQSDFGIKPFSALMGTLKVADRLEVRAEARGHIA
jgi:polyisoprenoid-binding protein YceI